MGLISGCRYLKVNLKAKMYIYVNSTIQRCPNKIIKIFLIEDFFHLPPVSTTLVVNLELWIFPRIFEKIRNGPIGILWGWGETVWWKKTRSKKSCDTVPLTWCALSLYWSLVDRLNLLLYVPCISIRGLVERLTLVAYIVFGIKVC